MPDQLLVVLNVLNDWLGAQYCDWNVQVGKFAQIGLLANVKLVNGKVAASEQTNNTLVRSLVNPTFFLDWGFFNCALPFNCFPKGFFKNFSSCLSLLLTRVESLVLKMVLKHEDLGSLVVSFFFQHNAVFEHWAFKSQVPKVVVFF